MKATIIPDTARYREASQVTSNANQVKSGKARELREDAAGNQSRHFDYAGRSWRIYKRSQAEDAAYYFEFQLDGVKYGPKSLKTANWALAVTEAKLCIDAKKSNRREAIEIAMGRRVRQPVAPASSTFGQLFAVLERLDMLAEVKHRRAYVWGTTKFFAFALEIPAADVPAQPLALLNGATGEKFFQRAIAHALTLPEQAAQLKFKRQAVRWFTYTKALFAADAVRSMAALGLTPLNAAAVAEFRASKPKRFKVSNASEFVAPSNAVLRETFRQWIKLGAIQRHPVYYVRGGAGNSRRKDGLQPLNPTARRNMFIAIGYMLSCGLRKGEVAQLRERHVTRDGNGVPRLVAEMSVKNKSARLEVKPLNPFWRILQKTIARNGWAGSTGGQQSGGHRPPLQGATHQDFVLVQRAKVVGSSRCDDRTAQRAVPTGLVYFHGGHSDRTYWPFYHIGKWLRELGWKLQKTNHALRDCAGSLVTMKFGLDRAKIFCRHATRETTESHYSRFVDEDLMDNPNRLAWLRWAK